MRALVITVAGLSSRFGESLGRPALKCIYNEGDTADTLLARLLRQTEGLFDSTVVVGGYKFAELQRYFRECKIECSSADVLLVENPCYSELASGWSLYVGLETLAQFLPEEIVFVEGDLYLDDSGLFKLCTGSGDAVTTSPDAVIGNRSVALYCNADGRPCYAYSEAHGLLEICEPFSSIQSSGQAWRFGDVKRLLRKSRHFAKRGGVGTNLEIINPYFAECDPSHLDIINFKEWINCNTIQDWRRAFARREVRNEYER